MDGILVRWGTKLLEGLATDKYIDGTIHYTVRGIKHAFRRMGRATSETEQIIIR